MASTVPQLTVAVHGCSKWPRWTARLQGCGGWPQWQEAAVDGRSAWLL